MGWVVEFYRSTIGKKIVMAVTGVVLVGYVVVHVLGNLLVFRGPEAINAYAELLKSSALVLWSVRAILLTAVVLHIHAAWSLTRLDLAARPERYERLVRQSSTWSARSMRVGGVILLVFVVFHLLHFTTGTVHPAFSPLDVYNNVLIGFGITWVVVFYVVAMLALGLHLHHGIWSAFQTLGLNHPHMNPARRTLATVVAILVAAGFISIPLAVAFGLLP
jgi:succinate dehydrogenase / fumarate reductase, cytochrome b subunit